MAQQQCCGPLQLPVADVAVMAQAHTGLTGAASAIGEQPLKGLVDPAAMARLALAEALTNLVRSILYCLLFRLSFKFSGFWVVAHGVLVSVLYACKLEAMCKQTVPCRDDF